MQPWPPGVSLVSFEVRLASVPGGPSPEKLYQMVETAGVVIIAEARTVRSVLISNLT